MRFFRFVIILLPRFLHYHIYHHLAFLCQPIRPPPGCRETSGGRRRTDLTGIAPILLSDLMACDAFNARTVTDREYHYHLCGSSPCREPPDSSRLCAAALRTEFVPDV